VPPWNQQVMWATTNTMDYLPPRSEEGTRKLMEGQRKGRTGPSNLREQVDPKTMQLWRTPTTMDSKEDSLKHATKLLQGKNLRSTGARIQITLADEVMVEEIKANPELMEQYKDYEMVTRKNLPEQQEFVDYMREQTTVAALFEKTGIKRTTIEHWFRRDKAGFSHPSIEDWEKIKPHLTTVKYDKEMTTLHSIEWKEETKIMWPTPTTKGFGHASEGQTMIMRRKVEAGELTEPEAQAMMNGTTLRPPRLKEWTWPTPQAPNRSWPTPTARDWKDSGENTNYETARKKSRLAGTAGGALNPTWVEWLMGYPAEYTVLKDWAILSSRKSSKKSAKQSLKPKKNETSV